MHLFYLIKYVSAEALTTGRMIRLGTKCPPAEVSTQLESKKRRYLI
jgi:hypothetical protein